MYLRVSEDSILLSIYICDDDMIYREEKNKGREWRKFGEDLGKEDEDMWGIYTINKKLARKKSKYSLIYKIWGYNWFLKVHYHYNIWGYMHMSTYIPYMKNIRCNPNFHGLAWGPLTISEFLSYNFTML